jgi:tetratricopeptide (TPR) repeat protein
VKPNANQHSNRQADEPSSPRLSSRLCLAFFIAIVLILCASRNLQAAAPSSSDPAFQQGIQAYLSADYLQAAQCFQAAATNHLASGVFQNLGNATWKCGRTGAAIQAWEQALWLDPFNRNAKANLRYARKAAQLEGPDLAWYEICSAWLPNNAWAWIASSSFWLSVALLLLPGIVHWRKADWQQGLAAASVAVFLLTLPALVGIQTRSRSGVILPDQVLLRLTPTEHSEALAKLAGGEMARQERIRGEYAYVRTANDTAGWVKQTELGLICPETHKP